MEASQIFVLVMVIAVVICLVAMERNSRRNDRKVSNSTGPAGAVKTGVIERS